MDPEMPRYTGCRMDGSWRQSGQSVRECACGKAGWPVAVAGGRPDTKKDIVEAVPNTDHPACAK